MKAVTVDDCQRLLRERMDPQMRAFSMDPRYVDDTGRATPRLVSELERAGQRVFSDTATKMYTERGVTCFSELPTNTLLWSHYGGAHRGVCLEFDTFSSWFQKLHAVRYRDDIPEFDIVDVLLDDATRILEVMLTKATCWSYEQEWRAIHKKADKEYCYGVEALTGVYLGATLTESEKDLVCHILHGTPTKIFEMRRSSNSFHLEVRSVEYTPYHHPRSDAI